MTDHRINMTLHKLEQVLDGGLDEFVQGLRAAHTERLAPEA